MSKTISISRQRQAYAKTNGICVICGKPIKNDPSDWSVDHFVPQAVSKWSKNPKLQGKIGGEDNLFVVHPSCNYKKDSALPTNQSIRALHADKDIKDELKELYKSVETDVAQYRSMKQRVLALQNYRCKTCGKKITLNSCTLRRINNDKSRIAENAMCMCSACNIKAGSETEKAKLLCNRKSLTNEEAKNTKKAEVRINTNSSGSSKTQARTSNYSSKKAQIGTAIKTALINENYCKDVVSTVSSIYSSCYDHSNFKKEFHNALSRKYSNYVELYNVLKPVLKKIGC